MKSSLSTGIIRASIFSLLAIPCIAFANSQSALPNGSPSVNSAMRSLDTLAKSARKTVTGFNTTMLDIEKRGSDLNGRSQRLLRLQQDAQASHQSNEVTLRKALNDNYRAETASVIIPMIKDVHSNYLGYVDRFRRQAGIIQDPRVTLTGEFQTRRAALGNIVSSLERDLGRVKTSVRNRVNFLSRLINNLNEIRFNPQANQTVLGFEHFLNQQLQLIDGERYVLQNSSTFFNGKNFRGVATSPPADRCRIVGFQSNLYPLSRVIFEAEQAVLPRVCQERIQLGVRQSWYENNTVANFIGFISGWNACAQVNENNAVNFRRDVDREIARKNFELARALDVERGNSQYLANIAWEEAAILSHLNSEIQSIEGTVSAMDIDGNRGYTPPPFRVAAISHVHSLTMTAEGYPRIFEAADALMERAQREITTLGPIQGITARNAEIALVNEKLQSIIESGFNRLIEQLDSIGDQLTTMSLSARSGSQSLEVTINAYETSARTKANFWSAEQARLPVMIAESQRSVKSAQDNFNRSLELVRVLNQDVERFNQTFAEYNRVLERVRTQFSNNRFNPIYSELAGALYAGVANNAGFRRAKNDIDAATRNYLAGFQGILEPKPAGAQVSPPANPPRKLNRALFRALESRRKQISRNLDAQIETLTAPYLEGSGIATRLRQLRDAINLLQSIQP